MKDDYGDDDDVVVCEAMAIILTAVEFRGLRHFSKKPVSKPDNTKLRSLPQYELKS